MEQRLSLTNFYNHPRFWRHFIPWILFFVFFFAATVGTDSTQGDGEMSGAWDRLLLVIFELLLLIYSSFYAYNKLFHQRKFLPFAFILILIVLGVSTLDHFANTGVIQMGPIQGFFANLILFPFVLLVAFGLKLAWHGTRQLFVIERLQAKQTESELKLLKSQVNPHFLFNTLNNIYSTNLEDHDKANEIILGLSDLLRYQLESYKKKFTPLQEEISSLESYIELEKIRVLDCTISLKKKGDFSKAEIVPLLLLPFVENAFKYGTGIEPGVIDISFDLSTDKLFHFSIANKIVLKKGKVHSGGIGLENVKKRLALMYDGRFDLKISEANALFNVDLKIKL